MNSGAYQNEWRPTARSIFVKHNTINTEKILQASKKEKSSQVQRYSMALDFSTATVDARKL